MSFVSESTAPLHFAAATGHNINQNRQLNIRSRLVNGANQSRIPWRGILICGSVILLSALLLWIGCCVNDAAIEVQLRSFMYSMRDLAGAIRDSMQLPIALHDTPIRVRLNMPIAAPIGSPNPITTTDSKASLNADPGHSIKKSDPNLLEETAERTCVIGKEAGLACSGELETKAALERLLRVPFQKVRPVWLRNPATGRNLEIDCYNDELKLGVEFDGLQHYVFPNPFHKTRQEFEAQQQRDVLKRALATKQGVTLLTVPFSVSRKKIEAYLEIELRNHGIPIRR